MEWNEVFTPNNSEVQEITPPTPNDPDWVSMMRNASNTQEKWKIMSAREEWEKQRTSQRHAEAMADKNKEIQQILNMHQADRNKYFYEKLQKENGSLYFSPEIQRQKSQDRKEQGLAFHLKRSPIKWS